jgi:hypothetical protein
MTGDELTGRTSETNASRNGQNKAVLVYEPDASVASYLKMLLEYCGFRVVGTVAEVGDLQSQIAKTLPEATVISHPNPTEALKAISRAGNSTKIVLCTDVESENGKMPPGGAAATVWRSPSHIGRLVGALNRV